MALRRLFNAVFYSEEAAPEWQVGGRYEVLRPVDLVRVDEVEASATLMPEQVALVLAVRAIKDDEGEEVVVGYLADTRSPTWRYGWGQLCGPRGACPVLRAQVRESWDLGGCYRVNGQPVLRTDVDLEAEPLCELDGPREEVLLLELCLVVSEEPRLRGKVRTDRGLIGWLTIELPGAPRLLQPANLLRKETVLRRPLPLPLPPALDLAFPIKEALRSTRRAPVLGAAAYPWDVGGVYRTLEKLQLESVGTLRAGKLVRVEAIRPNESSLRVQLRVESGTLAGRSGWVSLSSQSGALDLRNHLEFQQVAQHSLQLAEPPPGHEAFTARIARDPNDAKGLGLQLETSSLVVDRVLEEGAFTDWNQANPSLAVQRGDKILKVNGLHGNPQLMISEMREKQVIYVRFARGPVSEPQDAGETPVIKRGSLPTRRVADLTAREKFKQRCNSAPAFVEEEDKADETEEEKWKREKKALATPSPIVCQDSKASIRIAEDEPDWKPFYEEGQEERGCPDFRENCREQCREYCQEESVLSFLSCGRRGPSSPIEPAPEPLCR
ncbi:unnamed protein product [Effrenium voratum]|uniref:PDZ domain-containing protein n=1 Tax=Effrenium voratum TaxID=2562239 RepID=A0AA36IE14_9DINO|nr:unnamed protein product [Effrenium voratum]CAJ1426286.1 unnamed protein product [Effrenium voratum]